MKFSELSSGWKSRPAKAEPGRLVVSLAAQGVTAALMRRHANVWAVGLQPTKVSIRDVQGVSLPEDSSGTTRKGRGSAAPGEVFDHGTYEQDSPVTRESQLYPSEKTWPRRVARSQVSNKRCVHRGTCSLAKNKPLSRGRPKARGTGAEVDVQLEVGGLHMSCEGGEGMAPDPAEQRRSVSVGTA